jgi:hypothetical protein
MMNEKQPARDDYADLARRLGFDETAAKIEGPVRGPHAGPSDETPLEKLHRLSALMEIVAMEIRTMRSATYRAQLWQQWASIWRRRPERQSLQKRMDSASGGSTG